jgi:dTDP-4-dehydrorhamnose 3,5-epimerase
MAQTFERASRLFRGFKRCVEICAYDDETEELDEIVSTGENLQVVRIPGHYWHGFKVVGDERAYLVYFVNLLYDYEEPDEERRAWNDPTVVPRIINGKEDDERCNKPWDWYYRAYK